MGIIRQNKRKINDGMMIQRKVKLIFHFYDGKTILPIGEIYDRWLLNDI